MDAMTLLPVGAAILPLAIIPTEGGPVLHMLRADSPLFAGFGEIYFSEVMPGAIKAWKRHTRQTQFFAVPVGRLRLVLYDADTGVQCEVILGRPDAYALLRIPPGLWYGFTALGTTPALMCNCANISHDPTESERRGLDDASMPACFGQADIASVR